MYKTKVPLVVVSTGLPAHSKTGSKSKSILPSSYGMMERLSDVPNVNTKSSVYRLYNLRTFSYWPVLLCFAFIP